MHTVHFSVDVASGANLAYRLHNQVIMNRDLPLTSRTFRIPESSLER